MPNEIEKLREIFETNNIPSSIDWLEACCQWCKEQILTVNYTFDQLRHAVHDQWLLFDLRELETPLLPAGLPEQKYKILEGNYSLQVMQVIDISKPKYWQIQQIRKQHVLSRPPKNETAESTGTGKRVLQLSLTDGVRVIEAMEYEPIKCLNINLTPGSKIRLCGPVTIRRGRLMLQEKNIQIIGGEVEDLVIPNAAENVLARILNLPENSTPQRIDGNLLVVNQETEDGDGNQPQANVRSETGNNRKNIVNQPIGNSRNPTTIDPEMTQLVKRPRTEKNTRNISGAVSNISQTRNNYSTASTIEIGGSMSKNNQTPEATIKDPLDEEMELLMEAEMEFQNEFNTNRMRVNKTPDLFDEDFDTDQIEDLIERTNKENDARQKAQSKVLNQGSLNQIQELPQVPTSSTQNCRTNLFDEFINEDDFFGTIDIDSLIPPKVEVLSITKLLQNIRHVNEGVFRIRAKFKSVAEKLTLREEEYKLAIIVEDDSNELKCQVHNDVISQWAGLTPKEISQLKAQIISQDVESKKKVENALQNIKDRLLEIDHQLEIQISREDAVPIIKSISY